MSHIVSSVCLLSAISYEFCFQTHKSFYHHYSLQASMSQPLPIRYPPVLSLQRRGINHTGMSFGVNAVTGFGSFSLLVLFFSGLFQLCLRDAVVSPADQADDSLVCNFCERPQQLPGAGFCLREMISRKRAL